MKDETRTTIQFGDSPEIDITGMLGGRMKNTLADTAVIEKVVWASGDEIRSFVERFEQLDSEKRDIADQQKEVMIEAKSRGYDTKILKTVIARRKIKPDALAESEAILDVYLSALGMR
jgi:uncharacterized protein (UPF0335 family)